MKGTLNQPKYILIHKYVNLQKTEAEILEYVKGKDPIGKYNIVRMIEAFNYGKNYCMVFEKLGKSLYDFIKKNRY